MAILSVCLATIVNVIMINWLLEISQYLVCHLELELIKFADRG